MVDGKDTSGPRLLGQNHDLAPEQLRAGFEARQSNPAYQEMLVRSSTIFSVFLIEYHLYRNNVTVCQLHGIETKLYQHSISLRYWFLAVKPDGKASTACAPLSSLLTSSQWKIYPIAHIHPRGSTFQRKALQNILHRTTAYLSYFSRPTCLSRTWRSTRSLWNNKLSGGLLDQTRK